MKTKIVILGANEFQAPLIERARALGYETHVFAWAAGDVGESLADKFYPVSIVEKKEILKYCREIRPNAVCTIGSDLAAITANYVSNRLGLPSNPEETAYLASNKYQMRQAFQRAGIAVPKFFRVSRGEETAWLPESLTLPVIVKPTDRSGSRGITKLTSWTGLNNAISVSAEESFEHCAIVEEYWEGEEFSCECISFHGMHTVLAVTRKFTTGAPHFIEVGHIQPSGLSEERLQQVQKTVFEGLDALHILEGASHAEFKITPEGAIRLIEIGARMGGDCIGSDLVPLSTGKDFLRMVLDTALGTQPDLSVFHTPVAAAIRFVFGEDDLENLEWLWQEHPEALVRVSRICMGRPEAILSSGSRFGFYIVQSSGRENAAALTGLRWDAMAGGQTERLYR